MKIIFFSSHTAIWKFALAEAIVASALQKKGHDILYITPGGQFTGKSNLMQERIMRREFNLKGYVLGDVLTKDDTKKINLIMSRLTKDNFENLKIDNVNIGKIAMYEFLLNHKKMNAKFAQSEWHECIVDLKDALTSFFACRAIIRKEKPDRILMYGELYSVNHVWERYATLRGIPVYFLHNGLGLSDTDDTLIIARTNSVDYFHRLINIWSKVKDVPVPKKILSYVTDNFFELLRAKHFLVYSSPKSAKQISVRKLFDIKEGQKILTATMSSYDEVFAAQYVEAWETPKHLTFSTQVEWISALVDYVENRKNLFLIIRVHPREFPNKREDVKSDHAKMLEKVLKDLPDNVKINWPTQNISIYDLAQETDVFLNAWSFVGVEMSLLGIPVVLYSKDLVLYPSDLNYVAKNRKAFFAQIELALKDGWSYEKVKKTYRWLAMYYGSTIIRFRGKKGEFNDKTESKKLFSAITNYFYSRFSSKTRSFLAKFLVIIPGLGVGNKQKEDCERQLKEHVDITAVEKMLQGSRDTLVDINEILKDKVSSAKEDEFIRKEIKRIYKAMYRSRLKDSNKKDSLQYNLKGVFAKK